MIRGRLRRRREQSPGRADGAFVCCSCEGGAFNGEIGCHMSLRRSSSRLKPGSSVLSLLLGRSKGFHSPCGRASYFWHCPKVGKRLGARRGVLRRVVRRKIPCASRLQRGSLDARPGAFAHARASCARPCGQFRHSLRCSAPRKAPLFHEHVHPWTALLPLILGAPLSRRGQGGVDFLRPEGRGRREDRASIERADVPEGKSSRPRSATTAIPRPQGAAGRKNAEGPVDKSCDG